MENDVMKATLWRHANVNRPVRRGTAAIWTTAGLVLSVLSWVQSFPIHSALDDVREGLESNGGAHGARLASAPLYQPVWLHVGKVKVFPLQAMKAHGGCGCKGPHIHSHGTRKR